MRLNVYVPDDLGERMSAAKEEHNVNWSAIAQAAFQAELGRLAEEKREMEMSDVVERLRASKDRESIEMFEGGKAHGTEWARRSATVAELQQLKRNLLAVRGKTLREVLSIVVGPDDLDDAFESMSDETSYAERMSQDYGNGFVEGALDVWLEVEHEL